MNRCTWYDELWVPKCISGMPIANIIIIIECLVYGHGNGNRSQSNACHAVNIVVNNVAGMHTSVWYTYYMPYDNHLGGLLMHFI